MPNSQHCLNCTAMKPCKCKGLLSLFKARPFSKFLRYLHRNAQRRRSSRRFRSVHAVFWPLISMRSDERERTTELPSLALTETETVTETVLQPLPIEPTPPPATSSYTKVEPIPLTTSSYTNVEPTRSPATSSYTKVEPTPPTTSSYTNVEPTRPPLTSSYTKAEPTRTPLTSPYIKMATRLKGVEEKKTKEDFEVQKACRTFEKYIMEMLLEERKVRDLLDVEELMYCMDNLQSPAFIELVCTFYGELCMDFFSNEGDQPVLDAGRNY